MMNAVYLYKLEQIYAIVYNQIVLDVIFHVQSVAQTNVATSAGKITINTEEKNEKKKEKNKQKNSFIIIKLFLITCRIHRRWIYDSIENEGSDVVMKNSILKESWQKK